MKNLLLIAALAGVSFTGSAFAYSPHDVVPAPRVVHSTVVNIAGLPRSFTGALVYVEFSLNAAGYPRRIRVLQHEDQLLKERVRQAVSHWRFSPGATGADASKKRFILPLQINPEV